MYCTPHLTMPCSVLCPPQEPRQSPSHGTTTTGSMSFDLPQPMAVEQSVAEAAGPGPSSIQQQQEEEQMFLQQQTASQLTAPTAAGQAAGSAAAAGSGSTTPGDGLGLLLHGGPDLEETTTPELEQIGIVPSQEGGSQQPPPSAAAAAAAGVGGGRAPGASAGRGRGGGSSGGRGTRGPGVVCEEVTAKQMLFPIFRPRQERKCIILVRHGESSEYACCRGGKEGLRVLLPRFLGQCQGHSRSASASSWCATASQVSVLAWDKGVRSCRGGVDCGGGGGACSGY